MKVWQLFLAAAAVWYFTRNPAARGMSVILLVLFLPIP